MFQHVDDADGGDVGGENGPAQDGDVGLRREIVDFVRLHILHDAQQAGEVAKVAVVQMHLVGDAEPTQPVILDAAVRRAANDAMHLVTLAEQELRQIGPVLSRAIPVTSARLVIKRHRLFRPGEELGHSKRFTRLFASPLLVSEIRFHMPSATKVADKLPNRLLGGKCRPTTN